MFLFSALVAAAESDVTLGNQVAEQPRISRPIGSIYQVTSGETAGCHDDDSIDT